MLLHVFLFVARQELGFHFLGLESTATEAKTVKQRLGQAKQRTAGSKRPSQGPQLANISRSVTVQ
jgi:hypothetical protein